MGLKNIKVVCLHERSWAVRTVFFQAPTEKFNRKKIIRLYQVLIFLTDFPGFHSLIPASKQSLYSWSLTALPAESRRELKDKR